MAKTEETKRELKHLKTYDDLTKALGKDVEEFLTSGEFDALRTRMVFRADRRKTCERCGKEAEKIFAKDLSFLAEKSTFPYDYAVLCPVCEEILTQRLKQQIENQ
jgi:hypothetical protein